MHNMLVVAIMVIGFAVIHPFLSGAETKKVTAASKQVQSDDSEDEDNSEEDSESEEDDEEDQ